LRGLWRKKNAVHRLLLKNSHVNYLLSGNGNVARKQHVQNR
jgi:hypothetical protein